MSAANVAAALVAFLKADADVAAEVGGRVFGSKIPAAEAAAMPRKAVAVTPSGGPSLTGGSTVEHDTQRIDVFSYGATDIEADQLGRTVALALRRLDRSTTGAVLIHWVQSAGGYALDTDPDADWPSAFQSFQAFYALEAVA